MSHTATQLTGRWGGREVQVDQVMLLAHGRMVYSGVQSEMVEYVSGSFRAIDNNDNPFDYAMEFLSGLTEQQADQVQHPRGDSAGARSGVQSPSWCRTLEGPVSTAQEICTERKISGEGVVVWATKLVLAWARASVTGPAGFQTP